MLATDHRAALAKIGIADDLRVRCWFTLTTPGAKKKTGQWEEGVVTRVVKSLDEDAFFVSYPDEDGEEWPVGVQFSCAPVGKTWRPGWTSRKQPPSTPEKTTQRVRTPSAPEKLMPKKLLNLRTRPRRPAAERARARVGQNLADFENESFSEGPQIHRRPRAQESDDEPIDDKVDDKKTDQQWQHVGSKWVGECVLRIFGASKPMVGRVVRWLPAGDDSDEPTLYKVEHMDGGLEDLEEHEVRAGRDLYRHAQQHEEDHEQKHRHETYSIHTGALHRRVNEAEKTNGLSGTISTSTLSPSMRARLELFDTCQDKAALNIAKGDPKRGFLPYLKPGGAMWNESMRLFYAEGGSKAKSEGHIFGEIPGGKRVRPPPSNVILWVHD